MGNELSHQQSQLGKGNVAAKSRHQPNKTHSMELKASYLVAGKLAVTKTPNPLQPLSPIFKMTWSLDKDSLMD